LTTEVEGLGIDVVELSSARGALVATASVFGRESEVEAAKSVIVNDDALALAVLFSAKETAIKAMTESLDRYVEFTDVTIDLEPTSFTAHYAPSDLAILGWWTLCGDYVFTAAARH
jgi:phosphopantetheinyl transferase (holo-ACP synthase)